MSQVTIEYMATSCLSALTFWIVQNILFLDKLKQMSNLPPFFYPRTIRTLTFDLLGTKHLNHVSHLRNNYIFGILEPWWNVWYTFKQYSSTINFGSLFITLWGHFQTPIFQNAQWCQSGISLFLCQDMLKSQKQPKNYNYTWLQCPMSILLFVNSNNTWYSKCWNTKKAG